MGHAPRYYNGPNIESIGVTTLWTARNGVRVRVRVRVRVFLNIRYDPIILFKHLP